MNSNPPRPRWAFVTGTLAEPALRRLLTDLAPKLPADAVVVRLPISVAALLTCDWVARHWPDVGPVERVVLPGFCRGDVQAIAAVSGASTVERGPKELLDLPALFGGVRQRPSDYGEHRLEIVAEINHAPRLPFAELLAIAERYRADGADVIDVGCDPGATWAGVGDAVKMLRDHGLRVSVDSLNVVEIATACRAGAELVLSVNASNRDAAGDWGAEVVVIPDDPHSLAGLDETVDVLSNAGVPYRIDPILEPIGFGFAASLGRYLDVRRRYPDATMLMGVGNLTELTDVDSAGVNVLLAGFCAETRIGSVLTTEVIPWARSCVKEIDLARRLVHSAVTHGVLPKRLEPGLVCLRDPDLRALGADRLAELAAQVRDRNYRLFAEGGELHAINGAMHLRDDDPFALFAAMCERDATMDVSHAFYLGYEMAKAVTALTLGKQYRQDQALTWGHLTRQEQGHRSVRPPSPPAKPGGEGGTECSH